MAKIKAIKVDGTDYDIRGQIYYGVTDSTSTATAFTSQISGITEYFDGLTIYLFNNKIATASGITLNINSLGAKKIYRANANAELTTHWAVNTGYLLVYNSSRNSNAGGWDWQTGYDSNSDSTCAGNIRNTYTTYTANGAIYDYMLCFQSSETQVIPANTVDGSVATTKTLNTASFLPGGIIGWYNNTTTIASGSAIPATNLWFGYSLIDLRYSFNSGTTLTANKDVYLRCTTSSGKLKFDGNDCITQTLPTTNSSKIYILLGRAYDTYRIAFYPYHPMFIYLDDSFNLYYPYARQARTAKYADNLSYFTWEGDVSGDVTNGDSAELTLSNTSVTAGSYGPTANATLTNTSAFTVPYVTFDSKGRATGAVNRKYTLNISSGSTVSPSDTTPKVDGTANKGSETAYARGDHVHPTNTAGRTMTGILTCQNNTSYTTKQARNIFILSSGSTPSGGANGDVALFY